MDDPNSSAPGLYDPTKASLPKRYRNRMPSLAHLKESPCTGLWNTLVLCYSLNGWNQNPCTSDLFAFEECKKNTKKRKVRIAEARFYLQNVMRAVKGAQAQAKHMR
jgi:hypothetical protein